MVWFLKSARPGAIGSVTFLLTVLTLWVLTVGCSGPIDLLSPTLEPSNTTLQQSGSESNRELWGLYLMTLNEDHTRIEVEPLRGAVMHLNCLSTVEAISPAAVTVEDMYIHPDGTITAAVKLTHPLVGFNEFTGFDVRGIMMLPKVYEFPTLAVSTPGVFAGESALLNADGYTRRWNPTEFSGGTKPFNYFDGKLIPAGMGALCTSTVNPFRTFATSTDRNYFAAGESVTRHYHVSFPPGAITFAYAIDASWEKHIVSDLFSTTFAEDDKYKDNWVTRNQFGGLSDYWQCSSFMNEVNVRNEDCLSYGVALEASILYSPKLSIPKNTSDVALFLNHTIALDEDNELDLCSVFLTPDQTVDTAYQIEASNHPYEYLDDPIEHFNWWNANYDSGPTDDEFDLSPVLTGFKAAGMDSFFVGFAFVTGDGDDITGGGAGWTLNKVRIRDGNAPPVNVPGDFPGMANSLEPYSVQLIDQQGGLECSLGKYAGGSMNLSFEVKDWQAGANVQFSDVLVEVPGIFEGVAQPWTGSGSVSTYQYEVAINNTLQTEPGEYPGLFTIKVPDEDPNYVPDEKLAAYFMFTLKVEEVLPPFCMDETSIHNEYAGTYQLVGSNPTQHLDCSFMPIVTGGAGALLFDGGITGGNEHLKVAPIDADGGDTTATTLFQRLGTDAGNATILQTNEYNGHVLLVTNNDSDNLLVYNAAGTLLKGPYDLGYGENSINEPVCLVTDPSNGDIWFVGDKGDQGMHLERWAYVQQGTTFEYMSDPSATLDLSTYLGAASEPLGIAINGYYHQLYLFHTRFFGSVDVFDISQKPPVHDDIWSRSEIFGSALAPTTVPGLRRVIGGDILIDHADGEQAAQCRILLFANLSSGVGWLYKLDVWCQTLGTATLGSGYSCMALNNLPDPADRSLVLFPLLGSKAYALFLPPDGW